MAAEQLRSEVNTHQRKTRAFDGQLADERSKAAGMETERDSALAEVRKQQTIVIQLKQELATAMDQQETLETSRKRAVEDLQSYVMSSESSTQSVGALESKIKNLEASIQELNEECDEQHQEITKLKQEKERMGVELHRLQSIEPVEADIHGRERLQHQVKELQEQLEDERRARTKVPRICSAFLVFFIA